MKKQKGKSQKPGGTKKKDDSQEVTEETDAPNITEQGADTAEQIRSGTDVGNDESSSTFPGIKDEAMLDKSTDDAPEPPASNGSRDRQPSLSIQSKMRSSSFRRQSLSQGPLSPSANGPKSPDLPTLTPDGDSVNSIYRKQAARLDELERENRRLAKEAQENERRWRKTEDELEELREASGEVAQLKARAEKADAQIQEFNKVVGLPVNQISCLCKADVDYRSKKTRPSSARIPNFSPSLPNVMSLPRAWPRLPRALYHLFRHNWTARAPPLNPWKWRSPTSARSSKSPLLR